MNPSVAGPVVTDLFFYPVKSLSGIRLEKAAMTPRGIRHDRIWMLVRDSGRFITQREEHRLALLRVTGVASGFHIQAPDGSSTTLPIDLISGSERRVSVWKDEVVATDGPADASRFFTAYLGYSCTAVRMPEDGVRRAREFAPSNTPLSFADAYPGLLTTEASLDHLNGLMSIPIVMRRFRPNIVASASIPYVEDTWALIQIGEVEISCVKPCARCVLTTVDPDSGTTGKEPLKTLARYRRIENDVLFGQNFVVTKPGTVRVGDRIEILERKVPPF